MLQRVWGSRKHDPALELGAGVGWGGGEGGVKGNKVTRVGISSTQWQNGIYRLASGYPALSDSSSPQSPFEPHVTVIPVLQMEELKL